MHFSVHSTVEIFALIALLNAAVCLCYPKSFEIHVEWALTEGRDARKPNFCIIQILCL